VVAFSGGRDSSAVLALAVHLARRNGLPLPIPVTRRFPDEPDTDESAWQASVVRHLDIDDWVRLDMAGDCDLVGPLATPILRRHGLLWPPTAHVNVPLFEVASGGTMLTGEGGDAVFGPHRVTPILHVVRGGRRRRRGALRHLPGSIGPAAARRWHWRRLVAATDGRHWLQPGARAAIVDAIVSERVMEPVSWRAATLQVGRARGWVLGAATMQRLAEDHDVRLCHPLLDAAFLRALSTAWSRLGPMTRADAMRNLFGDLLPSVVLRRPSKASFNTVLVGEASRGFAQDWRGGGVDTRLVDAQRLRHEWLRAVPHAGSFVLLQAAFLATRQSAVDVPR
jgi:asparagine synthase (glutamine-hydrolysing)